MIEYSETSSSNKIYNVYSVTNASAEVFAGELYEESESLFFSKTTML